MSPGRHNAETRHLTLAPAAPGRDSRSLTTDEPRLMHDPLRLATRTAPPAPDSPRSIARGHDASHPFKAIGAAECPVITGERGAGYYLPEPNTA
jgi:hypothetical protein